MKPKSTIAMNDEEEQEHQGEEGEEREEQVHVAEDGMMEEEEMGLIRSMVKEGSEGHRKHFKKLQEDEERAESSGASNQRVVFVLSELQSEWSIVAAHSRYHVLRNRFVNAVNVGQVSFASDGQTCTTTISTVSLDEIVAQCNSYSVKGDLKLRALAHAGEMFIHMRKAMVELEWKNVSSAARAALTIESFNTWPVKSSLKRPG